MKEYFNCFIGIPVDSKFELELAEVQRQLREYIPNAAVSETKVIHLTLYYLGRQSINNLEIVSNIIFEDKDIIAGERIRIGEMGIFNSIIGTTEEPYVVYLKVNHSHRLSILREHLSSHLDSFNKDEERSFIPHVTLARLKTDEAKAQFNRNKNEIEKLLSGISWEFELREIYMYGKTSPETAKFQDVLFKVPLI